VILLIFDQLNCESLIKEVYKLDKDSNKKRVHLILTSTNNQMNETLFKKVSSKSKNVTVFIYPSNRKIEKHLVLVQHITKYPEYNFTFIDLQNDLIDGNLKPLKRQGLTPVDKKSNYRKVVIKSNKFINKIVKGDDINLLRNVFVAKVD